MAAGRQGARGRPAGMGPGLPNVKLNLVSISMLKANKTGFNLVIFNFDIRVGKI